MGLMIDLQPSAGPALVVGGGKVALRKARALSEAGFATTVVAPEVLPEFERLPGVGVERRAWTTGEPLGRFAVAFACTGERALNRALGEAARAAGVPVVVADSQGEGTAFSPAVYREGALLIGVSTGGASPGLAAEIRDRLAAALGDGLAAEVEAARDERHRTKAAR